MRILLLVALICFLACAHALPLAQRVKQDKCAPQGGKCQNSKTLKCGGVYKSGFCPGNADIKCCFPAENSAAVAEPTVNKCVAAGGKCMSSLGNSCATGFQTGMCPGAADIKCCISGLTFERLEKCYPQGEAEAVKKRIGGRVNADWITNTCAIRMSHTLNCAGSAVPDLGAESISGGTAGWKYIFRVKQLAPIIKARFGKGVTYKATDGKRGVDYTPLKGKTGIIYFDTTGAWTDASGHFDLWDGKEMVENSHRGKATTDRYFGLSVSVTFWEFP